MYMKQLISISLIVALIFSCSDGEESGISVDNIDGFVQKGPYIGGTQVQIISLNSDLSQTGTNYTTEIGNDQGFFSINNINLASQYLKLSGIGYYFNEISGRLSNSNLSLQTIANIENKNSLNINILTHLERKRVEYLFANGMTFTEAKTKATNEIFNIFCFSAVNTIETETLNILKNGENNAKLLAISLILQANLSVADLSELLFDISADLETDGILDDNQTIEYLRNAASSLIINDGLNKIRENIKSRADFLGLTDYNIPDFESHITDYLKCNSKPPIISKIVNVDQVTENSANISTFVQANSSETNVILEYGPTHDYGSSISAEENPLTGEDIIKINFNLEGLSSSDVGEQYFFRVRAENSKGVVYSNYETKSFLTRGVLFDIDNNKYYTVKIDQQYWMASNLKTSTYKNGQKISDWLIELNDDNDLGAWLFYEDKINYNELYGKWYNSNAINSSNGLCPDGWRIPNANDIDILGNYLGTEDQNNLNSQWFDAGAKMRVNGESGFEGYGNGYVLFRNPRTNIDGDYFDDDLGETAKFWILGKSPSNGDPYAYFHFNTNGGGALSISGLGDKEYGYCVRCIKE